MRDSSPKWQVLFSARLWLAALMGFAGGLPLMLTLTVLQAWLSQQGVSLATIGMAGLVGLPYSIKFLWAPLVDRFKPLSLGRRRSWLLITQIGLAASIVLLGLQDPAQEHMGRLDRRCLRHVLLGDAGHRDRRLSTRVVGGR